MRYFQKQNAHSSKHSFLLEKTHVHQISWKKIKCFFVSVLCQVIALGVGHSQNKPPLSIIPFIMTNVVCVNVNSSIYDM